MVTALKRESGKFPRKVVCDLFLSLRGMGHEIETALNKINRIYYLAKSHNPFHCN